MEMDIGLLFLKRKIQLMRGKLGQIGIVCFTTKIHERKKQKGFLSDELAVSSVLCLFIIFIISER